MSVWNSIEQTASKVCPTQTGSKTIIAGTSWALGDAVKIMDASSATRDFIISHILVEYADAWEGY